MEGSNFKFELVKHFINKKEIQQQLELQNIQTIQKTPLILSDIVEMLKDKEDKFIYANIKKELQEVFSDFRYLSRGAQGIVILAKERQTNMRYTIKGYLVRDEEGNVKEIEELNNAKKEIEILSKCRGSPYVSNLIKPIDLEKNQLLYQVFTEYQGTLQELIDGTKDKKLNEISAIKYSKDIAEGLLHIHNKGYLVNDLKMDNILIDYNGNAVVSDFGYAQKLKKDQGYAQYEYEGNVYFQAPECVDREIVKLYEDEYKKLGVVTQVNPTQKSEACSFGYLIYAMVQGKKQSLDFMYYKHNPLVFDDYFKSFKYSQQLQKIIDGLTKFIPKERLSIKEALEQLKEIISIEFNQDKKLQISVSEQTQKASQKELNGIEFIETFDKQYYPIVKNEDSFLNELVEQLEKENKSLQSDQESLKKAQKEREKQIQEISDASQINPQKKDQEIMDLKQKQQTKDHQIENLENKLQNLQNLNLSLKQNQDNLQVEPQKKDQQIFLIEEQLQTLRMESEKLKQNQPNLQNQNQCFLVNQEIAQQESQNLNQQIRQNQERAQQEIEELKEKIKSQETQQDKNTFQVPLQIKNQEFQQNTIPQEMNNQQSMTNQQNQMFQGPLIQQAPMIQSLNTNQTFEEPLNQYVPKTQPLNSCQCKIDGKCQKACAKCGHKFCGRYYPTWEWYGWTDITLWRWLCDWEWRGQPPRYQRLIRLKCCKCRRSCLGECSLGCKCDYCTSY